MPLQKLQFRPGVNRETTNYANEGGFFSVDKVRFRGGYAQKIGGWINQSPEGTFFGVPRSLWNWVSLDNQNLLAVGTNQKYYVELGGTYHDITPLESTVSLTLNPFTTVSGSKSIRVQSTAHGTTIGSFVTFTGAATMVIGSTTTVISGQYEVISVPNADSFTIFGSQIWSSSVTGGGSHVVAAYQIDAGAAVYTTQVGWGGPPWGFGGWGSPDPQGVSLRLWSQYNYGNDLIFAERRGDIYYWTLDTSSWTRAVPLSTEANGVVKFSTTGTAASGATTIVVADASGINTGSVITGTNIADGTYVTTAWTGNTSVTISAATTGSLTNSALNFSYAGRHVPGQVNLVVGSPVNDFTICLGATPYDPTDFTTDFDPLLVRWSDQDTPWEWVPETTNQSGEQRLANGSEIVTGIGTRQEILVLTDTSIYSMQYLGPPFVWGFNLLDQDISIASQNAIVSVNNTVYWMGNDKFFVYDGRVSTLPCSIRQHIFSNINSDQTAQICAGNNEAFSEVWWFYPGTGSNVNNNFVIYNYLEQTWSYGTLNRSAFAPQSIRKYAMMAFGVQTNYLSSAVISTSTSLPLINAASYPNTGVVQIDSEKIAYASRTETSLGNLTRGVGGTVAASHSVDSTVSLTAPNQVMFHERGWDDVSTGTAEPIECFIQSSDFDIGEGDTFQFVSRIIPDVKFLGSDTEENPTPAVTLSLYPRNYPGSAYGTPDSDGVTATVVLPVEQYTEQVFTRVRARQIAFRIASTALGVAWQLGAMRLDIRPDGKR
jgi:hypothetical protein